LNAPIYKASEWGARYHALDTHEALGAGSAGPGKTWVLLADPLYQIQVEHERCLKPEHPHHNEWGMSTGWALHLRRTRPMLEQTISRAHRLFPSVDPGVRWDAQKTTFTFSSGYKFQFGHCKDQNDWEIYLSNEYTHIAWDELVQFEEEQYDQVNTRLRSADPVLKRMLKIRAMSNPLMRRGREDNFSVRDPRWVRKRFVDPFPAGNKVLKRKIVMGDGTVRWRRWVYLPAKLSDNPDPTFVAQYEFELRSAKPHIRKALLDGDWYVTANSFFAEEWEPRLHVCKPFHIPKDWPRFRSGDWGFKVPGCIHWWAMDPDGNLFCYREFTFKGKTDAEVAKEVQAIEELDGVWDKAKRRSRLTGPMDNQLWEQRGDSGESKAEVFAKAGIEWIQADKRSRQTGAERLTKRLRDHQGGTTTPGIVFFDACTEAIRTIPALNTSERNPNEPEDGGDDHWYDSVVYACSYASLGRSVVTGGYRRESDDFDDDDRRVSGQNRGRYGYGSSVC
jgi:phage terminase large subunit